ncbi:F0F1 ATP synthase subunit gamma [Thermodesulfobacteriota bacterium]
MGRLPSRLGYQPAMATELAELEVRISSSKNGPITSMQAAEKNIGELEDDLQAAFRGMRQSAITAELLDIVSGFEALGGGTG